MDSQDLTILLSLVPTLPIALALLILSKRKQPQTPATCEGSPPSRQPILLIIATAVAILVSLPWMILSTNHWPLFEWTGSLWGVATGYLIWAVSAGVIIAAQRRRNHSVVVVMICLGVLALAAPTAGFGAYLTLNGSLDGTAPVRRRVEVIDWEVRSHKRTTAYRVTLRPWSPQVKTTTYLVKRDLFERLGLSSARERQPPWPVVSITEHRGFFGAPWYEPFQMASSGRGS